MTSKLDRRIKYTKMVLKESLIQLMKEKPIGAITIKELCERADINRSTFYAHYSDHYDLLHQIEEEIISDMNETLSKFNNHEDIEALRMITRILEYISNNKDIFQVLLSEHGDFTFENRVMQIAHDYTIKSWMETNNFTEDIAEYLSAFTISGNVKVIQTWLKNNLDKPPKELANIMMKLTKNGLSSFESMN